MPFGYGSSKPKRTPAAGGRRPQDPLRPFGQRQILTDRASPSPVELLSLRLRGFPPLTAVSPGTSVDWLRFKPGGEGCWTEA